MASAREQIISDGGEPTLGEVVRLAAKTRPDLPEAAFHRVAAEVLASQPGSTGEAVREAIQREVARRLRIDPMVKKAMAEAFAVVLNEFRDATLKDRRCWRAWGGRCMASRAGRCGSSPSGLRDAVPRPLTEEQILAWADAYYQQVGEWPQCKAGPLVVAQGETWAAVDTALRQGIRGLLGGSSLALLLEEQRGVRNPQNLPGLTHERIIGWADVHYNMTGEWPGADSGAILGAAGETWKGINHA